MQAGFFRKMVAATLGSCTLLTAGILLTVTGAHAQGVANTQATVPVSRVELYGLYSYFHPYQADINNIYLLPINPGAVAGANYYFNHYVGAEVEGGFFPHGPNDCTFTAQGGPVFRYQLRRVVPFAHVLAGGAKAGGPVFQPCTWGFGATGGLGVDYVLPGFHDHVAIRPIQADYEYNNVNYGPLVAPGGYSGGVLKENAYRLSAGMVLRFGDIQPPAPAALSCSATPGDAFAGDPVTINAQALMLSPKRRTSYTWSSTGGQITGTGDTVQVATAGLAPGTYVVTGKVSQGPKPYEMAECTARFAIKEIPQPPSITCSANPSSIVPGASSTITSVGVSPGNRPLTYSYATSAGVVTGTGSTATFSSRGAAAGTATITCNVVDDLGKSATATTTVQVMPLPVPPAPQTQPLCSITFVRDTKRPARVDNEAKGCLDDIALTLQRQSDSRLVIVGSHDAAESADIAAQRAVNTKLYLTKEKGIDASRILLRSGSTQGRKVEETLVPSGATYTPADSTAVDESAVKSVGQPYGVPGAARTRARRR